MTRNLKLSVDRGLCTSNGLCEHLLGDVFTLDEYRIARVAGEPIPETDQIWEAIESCPVAAIIASDAATGEELYP